MLTRCLNIIRIIEYPLVVFRDYSLNKWLFLKVLYLILFIFGLVTLDINTRIVYIFDGRISSSYAYISLSSSVVIIACAYLNVTGYRKLLYYTKRIHAEFQNDKHYKEQLKRIYWGLIVSVLINVLIILTISVTVIINSFATLNPQYALYMFTSDLRLNGELIVNCFFMRLVSCYLRTVTRGIKGGVEKDTRNGLIQPCAVARLHHYRKAFNYCSEISTLINKVFGSQITVIFSSSIAFHIMSLYLFITQSLKQNTVIGDNLLMYTYIVVSHMAVIVIVAHFGQIVLDDVAEFNKTLAHLLYDVGSDEKKIKQVRSFIRLASSSPIGFVLFGSVSIGYALLPSCFAFSTSYLIIILQFNNIV